MKFRLVRRNQFDIDRLVLDFMNENPRATVAEMKGYRKGIKHIVEMIFGEEVKDDKRSNKTNGK